MSSRLIIFLLFLTLALPFSANAIDPVIIKKAKPGAPPLKNALPRDGDFFSNDIDGVPTIKCSGSYSISQTFEPEEETTKTTDPNTGEVTETTTFKPYDVNKIAGAFLPVKEKWTNLGLDGFRKHVASRQKAISGSLSIIKKGFLSLNPDKAIGASNAARRTTPNSLLRCQRGQRLVKAVRLAFGGDEGTFTDEQVAWKVGGDFVTVVDNEKLKAEPVRISDIAIAMNQNPYLDLGSTDPSGDLTIGTTETYIFYDPDVRCGDTSPAGMPGPLQKFASAPSAPRIDITPQKAGGLYRATVEATDIGSNTRKFKTWSLDNNQPVEIENKKSSIPWGNAYAYTNLSYLVKPQKQTVPMLDLCSKDEDTHSRNKPNPLNFFKFAAEFYGTIVETAQTFSHPMHYEVFLDQRLQPGISADEVALKNYVTGKDQKKYFSDVRPVSSTDDYGKTFDPGNPYTRSFVSKQFLPKSWQ
ncbi:MAG: hypothetical protein WC851_05190 [Candidatus Shapirobacteria bacterium]|jgi:hypothetical protein